MRREREGEGVVEGVSDDGMTTSGGARGDDVMVEDDEGTV